MKVQGFDFKVVYRKGKHNPTDYNSRHALSWSKASEEGNVEEEDEDGEDDEVFVNSVVDSSLPDAVTLPMLQKETNKCDVMGKLKYCIARGHLSEDVALKQYKQVFPELSVAKQLVLRGKRIIIPSSLQPEVIALAHIGHQGSTKTKQYLRQRVWFPGMDKMVETHVESCSPCLAATPGENTQPLKPSVLPSHPWKNLACDFKGPVGNDFYFLLVIDEYSRFPEVEIVSSTKASVVIPKLEKIFSTHGVPEKLKTDNGPPFKSEDMKLFAKQQGFYHQRVEPVHPQSNGLAENFMRMLVKVAHTAFVEKKDPKKEVYRYLMSYRATPHSTTGASPAEMRFNRQIRTPVPSLLKKSFNREMARKLDMEKKKHQKEFHDQRHHAKPTVIGLGDTVLLKQRKTTTQPPYDPRPWLVIRKKGSMVTAKRGGKKVTRNACKFRYLPKQVDRRDKLVEGKKIEKKKGDLERIGVGEEERTFSSNKSFYLPLPMVAVGNAPEGVHEEQAAEATSGEGHDAELRRSSRARKPPTYLSDYVQ